MKTNSIVDLIHLDPNTIADRIMDVQDQLMDMIDSSDPLDMRLAVLSIVRDLDTVVCRLQDGLPLRNEDLVAMAKAGRAITSN